MVSARHRCQDLTIDMNQVLTAHAKLTISLRITGVRPDGYHLIDAEMVSIGLTDTITLAPGDGIEVTGPYAEGIPTDRSNLVAKVIGDRRLQITIDKRIPHGGGLGGGSTDAAAVLRALGHRLDTDGFRQAARWGADIPFCLIGGRARVRGIGDELTPLPHLDRSVTLVILPLRVSTPAVYQRWDELGGPVAPGPNDLEPAALDLVPELARWRDLIGNATGRTPILAGSGATWWVHGNHAIALADLDRQGATVIATSTVRPEADGKAAEPTTS